MRRQALISFSQPEQLLLHLLKFTFEFIKLNLASQRLLTNVFKLCYLILSFQDADLSRYKLHFLDDSSDAFIFTVAGVSLLLEVVVKLCLFFGCLFSDEFICVVDYFIEFFF